VVDPKKNKHNHNSMVYKENLRLNAVSLKVTANANENIKESFEETNIVGHI
jgi:hypothetical protein